MKLMEYMKDKTIPFFILLFSIFTIEIFLLIYEIGIFMKWYVPISIILSYFLMCLIEYHKRKYFYHNILNKMDTLDQKYLINEVIEDPNFIEGKILREILKDTNKSMLENVNVYKYAEQEYREYIELWIHEVKTPIATSKMIIENNKNEVTQNIEEELEKIDNYVEQALFYARSNTLEKDYLIKAIELDTVVNRVMLKNRKVLLDKKIKVELEEIEEQIYTDSKWLEFILNQIIINSINYSSKNPEIKIYAKKRKNKVLLFLQDNGIGIPENELNRVFEKGFTGGNGRRGNKSTGLGLYLCKKLCSKLSHTISIISEQGRGTTVKIIFPIGNFYLTNL